MTTYLDKEAVLKAFQERFKYPSYTFAEFIEQIEHGKFDVIPLGALATDCLAEKAEIRKLSNALASEKRICDELKEACEEHEEEIAQLKEELSFVSSSATIRGKSILASFRIIENLKSRIAQQDQELKDLGDALRYISERTSGRAHVLKFVTDEWQPVTTIAAFANRAPRLVRTHLHSLEESGAIESMYDEFLGVRYWRLKREATFHRASEGMRA